MRAVRLNQKSRGCRGQAQNIVFNNSQDYKSMNLNHCVNITSQLATLCNFQLLKTSATAQICTLNDSQELTSWEAEDPLNWWSHLIKSHSCPARCHCRQLIGSAGGSQRTQRRVRTIALPFAWLAVRLHKWADILMAATSIDYYHKYPIPVTKAHTRSPHILHNARILYCREYNSNACILPT